LISISVEHASIVVRGLRKLSDPRLVELALDEAAQTVMRDARTYPPERPGQRYKRRYLLEAGWARTPVERAGNAMRISVINDIPYAPFVLHPRRQAAIHRGRWRTTDEIAAANRDDVRAIVKSAIRRTIAQAQL